ncbi:MAG TPA: PilZ domain-containing protein [Thermoanaerobaculia bacterium]|nr:PilZ domain-containing protein [Thermoanaerobaculia bacterium]
MIVTRTADAAFSAVFESEQELLDEHRSNLSVGGLRLPTKETVAPRTVLTVTLRGPFGGEAVVKATVVAQLPDGIAVVVEGEISGLLDRLVARPPASEDTTKEDQQTSWDRMRQRSQMEKILLAVRADRTERAVLVQDNDPRVLLSVLRNPRLTVDEVVRIAKSSFLNFQIADVIMKTGQWMASLDVRLALIQNPKTPQAFALRILPTLPEAEVRAIARGGTNMALKQAALRRLQGKPS